MSDESPYYFTFSQTKFILIVTLLLYYDRYCCRESCYHHHRHHHHQHTFFCAAYQNHLIPTAFLEYQRERNKELKTNLCTNP